MIEHNLTFFSINHIYIFVEFIILCLPSASAGNYGWPGCNEMLMGALARGKMKICYFSLMRKFEMHEKYFRRLFRADFWCYSENISRWNWVILKNHFSLFWFLNFDQLFSTVFIPLNLPDCIFNYGQPHQTWVSLSEFSFHAEISKHENKRLALIEINDEPYPRTTKHVIKTHLRTFIILSMRVEKGSFSIGIKFIHN